MPFYIVKDHPKGKHIDAVVTGKKAPAFHFFFGAGHASIRAGGIDGFRYEIRTLCPEWKKGHRREEALLKRCYTNSLKLAAKKQCESILIPLLAENDPAFPEPLLYRIASEAIQEFLTGHEMTVYLLVRNRASFRAARPQLQNVHTFVAQRHRDSDSNAATTIVLPTQAMPMPREKAERMEAARRTQAEPLPPSPRPSAPCPKAAPMAAPRPVLAAKRANTGALPDLKDLIRRTDAGFSATLLRLIDETGRKDSEIYNKANVSRQHFSKIRNNPDYKPTKPTAIAFAIALELDLEQTQDLIGRAGYVLTDSIIFDVIIMYFIQKGNYNLFDINEALFEFDQMLLGA